MLFVVKKKTKKNLPAQGASPAASYCRQQDPPHEHRPLFVPVFWHLKRKCFKKLLIFLRKIFIRWLSWESIVCILAVCSNFYVLGARRLFFLFFLGMFFHSMRGLLSLASGYAGLTAFEVQKISQQFGSSPRVFFLYLSNIIGYWFFFWFQILISGLRPKLLKSLFLVSTFEFSFYYEFVCHDSFYSVPQPAKLWSSVVRSCVGCMLMARPTRCQNFAKVIYAKQRLCFCSCLVVCWTNM